MPFQSRLFASTALATLVMAVPAIAQIKHDSIETVTVTASPITTSLDRSTSIVSVIDRDEILRQGGASLVDSLKYVPGMANTGFASGASRPVIRGMDANRVKILEDGVSSSDVSDVGPDHGVPIDPLATQRLEVVRGAATLRYGSQAIGGVVNAINNRVPLTLPDQDISGEVHGSYGTNADTGTGGGMLNLKAGQFAFYTDGFLRTAGNYGTPLGTQNNSFNRQKGVSLGSSYFFGDSRVGAALVHYDSKYGIPSDTTYIDMEQNKLLTNDSIQINAGPLEKITFQGGYSDYKHSEKAPGGALISTFKNKEFDGRAEAIFGSMGPFSSSALGLQVNNRRFSGLGTASDYLLPTLTQTYAGYAFTEVPLITGLNLQAAGRVESVHITGTPASGVVTSRQFTPLSASAGLLWDATEELKFGLTLTSAARAPGQTELFARGGHDGPQTFETGDPNLKIERSNSVEGTVRANLGKFTFEGSVYNAAFSNYIYGNLTGRTCDDTGACLNAPTDELREMNYAQRGANFWGIEAKASQILIDSGAGAFSANMLADYVHANFSAGGGPVPRIQPYRVGGGLSWNAETYNLSVQTLGVGGRTTVSPFETPTDGYIEVNVEADWRPFTNLSGFEIALVGSNLTDAVRRNAVSINKDLVVLPGRDIRLVLRQTF